MKRHAITLLCAPLILGGIHAASANPHWARTLNDSSVREARADYVKMLTEQGEDAALADIRLKMDVVATSNDTGCPGLDVDVLNATDHTAFDVEVTVTQKLGTKNREDKLHLPYLPAHSQTKVSVECIENYTTRYGGYGRYSYPSIDTSDPISFEYNAKSERNLAEALRQMLVRKADASLDGMTITPKPGSQTLMQQAFDTTDPVMAHELVAAIAQTGVGAKELGEAMAKQDVRYDTNVFADEVAKSITTLPAAQQAKLARVLLASSAATQWQDKLEPLVDTKLCSGPRADVVALWMMAQSETAIPVAALRDKVRAKCTIQPTDGPAIVAALDQQTMYAGALDKVDAALFATVVAQWKKAKVPGASLGGFLAHTGDAARFDTAVALVVGNEAIVDAILVVAQGEASAEKSAASEHKAQWIAGAAGKLSLNDQDDLVRDIFGKLVDGHITDPAMRKAVRDLRNLAPAAADGTVATYAGEHSKIYDANKLADAKVDMLDFLAFATTSLVDCGNTLETLDACAQAIAKHPEYVKHGDLVKSDFQSIVNQLLSAAPHDKMVPVAKNIAAAGISIKPELDKLCEEVRDQIRWNGSYEQTLDLVKELPGGDVCVAEVGAQADSKHRTAIIMTVLAFLGLVLPIGVGWFFMRRRWRKFLAGIPKVEEVNAAAGARLDDRLGSAGLGNALAITIGQARREVDLPALANLDPNLLERIAATVRRAVKAGDAASLLARAGTENLYVLALPVKHARPQLVQRYLGAEWPEHIDAVRAAAGGPVTALVVLCDPAATEATLLVGYAAEGRQSDPDALLDAKEARERNANTFRGAMSLRVAAPTTAAAGA